MSLHKFFCLIPFGLLKLFPQQGNGGISALEGIFPHALDIGRYCVSVYVCVRMSMYVCLPLCVIILASLCINFFVLSN
jgi:hypothetical protein